MLSDDHFKAGVLGRARDEDVGFRVPGAQAAMANPQEHLNREKMKQRVEAEALGLVGAKQPTLQDITQRLRALMDEAHRGEELSEGLLSRITGSGANLAGSPEADGPSNGFITDTLDFTNHILGALERSNANMRRLQDAVMPHGSFEAAG